jgi:hypothetical protein
MAAATLPLQCEVLDPMREWRLTLADNPTGIELDALWRAETVAWIGDPVQVAHEAGAATRFDHFFQGGTYQGSLTIGGERTSVDGWHGQRDRSWGVRRVQDRLGMHVWLAVQLNSLAVGVHYNEDRAGNPSHCDGAVIRDHGSPVAVTGVRHDLQIDDDLELVSGRVEVSTGVGENLVLDATQLGRGIYMAGAGYGGWHGVPRGQAHSEHEVWDLAAVSPRSLPVGLVDKLCTFQCEEGRGRGVFELALSRSPKFSYRPTLAAV